MTKNIINISLPKFIAAWLINEAGGYPVRLAKSSVEFMILEQFSVSDPALDLNIVNDDTEQIVSIIVPNFKYKDNSYRFITDTGRKALEQCIKDRFNIALWKALHKFGNIGKKRKYIILAWMEANGIPDEGSNWDAIEKRYQRLRDSYLSKKRKKIQRNKKN